MAAATAAVTDGLQSAITTQLLPAIAHAHQALAAFSASVQHIPPVAQLWADIAAQRGLPQPDWKVIQQLASQGQACTHHTDLFEKAAAVLREAYQEPQRALAELTAQVSLSAALQAMPAPIQAHARGAHSLVCRLSMPQQRPSLLLWRRCTLHARCLCTDRGLRLLCACCTVLWIVLCRASLSCVRPQHTGTPCSPLCHSCGRGQVSAAPRWPRSTFCHSFRRDCCHCSS